MALRSSWLNLLLCKLENYNKLPSCMYYGSISLWVFINILYTQLLQNWIELTSIQKKPCLLAVEWILQFKFPVIFHWPAFLCGQGSMLIYLKTLILWIILKMEIIILHWSLSKYPMKMMVDCIIWMFLIIVVSQVSLYFSTI